MKDFLHASIWVGFLFLLTGCSCNGDKKDLKEKPAVQSNATQETELNTITLTDKAIERLGIKTVLVERQSVGNSREFSGEIVSPPGKTVTVTAPLAGTLISPRNAAPVAAGHKVIKGQPLYQLVILPAEKDLLSVQEEVTQKEIQHRVAAEKVKRTTLMYEERSGSLRAKQEAEAELAAITAQLRSARSRLQLLRGNPSQALADRMSTLNIVSPISGVIQKIYGSTSQVFSQASPIVDIVSLDPVWIRVPVYAGDQGNINLQAAATIRSLSDFGGTDNIITARPVTGPPTSDPLASSIDLYYEVANVSGNLRPGQRISVTINYRGKESSLVVPYAAVVYDIQGGTWVYEETGPRQYTRRRVELDRLADDKAIIRRGIEEGKKVVTEGTAELFGTEFGGGK